MEIRITKDIRKYKTKDVGNFSLKEVGWIVMGVVSAFVTYKLTASKVIALIPFCLFIVFGFLEPYGLTMIQFLQTVVVDILSPQIYFWETDFEYDFEEFPELYGDDVYFVTTDDALIQSANEPVKYNKEEKALLIK